MVSSQSAPSPTFKPVDVTLIGPRGKDVCLKHRHGVNRDLGLEKEARKLAYNVPQSFPLSNASGREGDPFKVKLRCNGPAEEISKDMEQ